MKRLRGKQLTLINPPRKGGNPTPKRGRWGIGISTETTRVPEGLGPELPAILTGILGTIDNYERGAKSTRDWVIYRRLINDLEPHIRTLRRYLTPTE